MRTVKINEIFHSIQGEGMYTGYPAIFVRFQGCNVGCEFCDTKYAQQSGKHTELFVKTMDDFVDQKRSNEMWARLPIEEVERFVKHYMRTTKTATVVITGGEPFLQAQELEFLCLALQPARICIETSGSVDPKKDRAIESILKMNHVHVTLSPKGQAFAPYWAYTDEVKMLVSDIGVDEGMAALACARSHSSERYRTFQPIWYDNEQRRQKAIRNAYSACIKYNGVLSVQMHKLIGIQ